MIWLVGEDAPADLAVGGGEEDLRRLDTSILHHAFISIFLALRAIITRYVTILMAILSYFTRFT